MEEKDKFLFEATVKSKEVIKATDTEEEKRIIEAFVATTDRDTDGDVIDDSALKDAADILVKQYSTLLYNHDSGRAIGRVLESDVKAVGTNKGLWIKALISKTEDDIWTKIQEGVLSKFSFWASVQRVPVFVDEEQTSIAYYRITKLFPYEASLVSVPANPNAVALDWYIEKAFNGGNTMDDKEKKKDITKADNPKPRVKIDSSDVSHTPWSKVNKTRIGQILAESGSERAIKEAFLVVPDVEKRSTWKFPHHELQKEGDNEYTLILSYTGLMAAYKAMQGARNKPDLSESEHRLAIAHLRKHFRKLISMGEYDEMPEGLKAKINEALKQLEEIIIEPLTKEEIMKELKDLLTRMKETEGDELKSLIEDAESLVEKIKDEDVQVTGEPKVEIDYDKIAEVVKGIVEELKPEEKDIEGEPTKDKDVDNEEVDALKEVVDELKSEIEKLRTELEEVKNKPIVKGQDTQRDEDITLEDSIKKEIESEEFNKKSPTEQLNVLRKLFNK